MRWRDLHHEDCGRAGFAEMTADVIIGELMQIIMHGDQSLSMKEAHDLAVERFNKFKIEYQKCGYLTKEDK
jgi:hypothetical protein